MTARPPADRELRPVAGAREDPGRILRLAPFLTVVVLLGPVVAGLAGTFAPAIGYMPAIGGMNVEITPFRELLERPGFWTAVRVSLATGLGATALSFTLVVLLCAGWQDTGAFRAIVRVLSPLLSVPHAAVAFGLAFLVAPSGWIARMISPWATGWSRPPDVLIVQDPWGLTLLAGLVTKEVPFLLLMTVAAIGQTEATRGIAIARSLGYGRVAGWLKVVFPRVYPQIRLPVYAVLAYSTSVVDVAMILGPSTPSTLAVQIVRWSNDPDLSLRMLAAAGAVAQLLVTLGALGLWLVMENALARIGRRWIEGGRRGRRDLLLRSVGLGGVALAVASVTLGLAALALWSVSGLWTFPDALPEDLTLRHWNQFVPGFRSAINETLVIAAAAAAVSFGLATACLEAEHRRGTRPGNGSLWLLYTPLVVPQIAFLLGLQAFMLAAGIDGGRTGVIFAHVVFVFPYVFLSFADPYRSWDTRYGMVARALGAGPNRVFWAVRLPMLAVPALTALAVGFAVSVGLYLPTLLIGAGRVATLTSEAVALASGGDRRLIGVVALAQTGAAFVAFAAAAAVPMAIRVVGRHSGSGR